MFIAGCLTARETFPFALGFCVRRMDSFLGTIVMILLVSAGAAFLLLALSWIESSLTGGWGVQLHFFYLPFVNDGNAGEQLWIYFMVMLCLYVLGFSVASLNQRLGMNGTLIFFFSLSLLSTVAGFLITRLNWWGAIFSWLSHSSAFSLALWLLPVTICCLLASYLLLRRATA